jgi:hypothetical protein
MTSYCKKVVMPALPMDNGCEIFRIKDGGCYLENWWLLLALGRFRGGQFGLLLFFFLLKLLLFLLACLVLILLTVSFSHRESPILVYCLTRLMEAD